MTRLLVFPLLVMLFLAATGPGSLAQDQRPLTAEDLWNIKRVGTPDVSPDGQAIIFPVTSYDIETNESTSDLYLMRDGEEPQQFTTHESSDSSPVWSPDGKKIAFVSARDEDQPAQLYVMRVDGGEPQQVTDLPVAVSAPTWFPDGNRIAFAASVLPGYDGDFDRLKEMLDEEEESKVSAKVTENRIYRHWDRWLTDGRYPRLFSVELESGDVTDLMPGSERYFAMMGDPQFDISPDGDEIAVSANSTEPPYEHLKYHIFLLPTDGSGEMEDITPDAPSNATNPVYNPDGSRILYGQQHIHDFYADRVRLVEYDRSSGEATVLTEEVDLSPSNWFYDEPGQSIYFQAEDRGMTSLFAIPAQVVQRPNVREVVRGGTNANAAIFYDDRLVFVHDNFSAPPELHIVNRDGTGLNKLTGFNDALLDEIAFGEVRDVTYQGADGAEVQMFIVYPPGFDEDEEWPLVQMIHGGPHGIFGDQFHFRWNAQLFAAPGYVVALPNFHGSTSFGQDFAISIHGDHATKPFRDIMKATDYMLEEGYIDEDRMAATGASYGGYMVSWIAGHTDRFAALVNHAGVYNVMTQFASDVTRHREVAYSGSPWENFDRMQESNPAIHAENFETPMLIIHGELDYRVPITHGLEIYGVYKGKGVDARLIYFPDENHWVMSPQNSIFWYQEVHDWLDRYLGTGPTGVAAREEG